MKQTNTQEFKKWFGNSKIVDENGNPLVVYHGTDKKFDEFKTDKISSKTDNGVWGRGFYLTPNKSIADGYGDIIMEMYVKIENPLVLDSKEEVSKFSDMMDEYITSIENTLTDEEWLEFMVGDGLDEAFVGFTEEILKPKYDGVIYEDGDHVEIVAFEPNQIKSATDNNGNFDPNSNLITEDVDIEIAKEYFSELDDMSKWILESIISNKSSVLFHGTNRDFDEFDISKNRSDLNKNFYGDGIFLTPSDDVAWKYANANRNSYFDVTLIDDIKKVNREAGIFLEELYKIGREAFTIPKNDMKNEFGGIDGNDLADISEVIEGSATIETPEFTSQDIFGTSDNGIMYYHIEFLNDNFNLDYRSKIHTYKIKPINIHDILITDDFTEAKNSSKEVVIVVNHSELVNNIPEIRFKSNKYIDRLVNKEYMEYDEINESLITESEMEKYDVTVNETIEITNQTDTQEFKKWFGDSKITVDSDIPLVVYHGTDVNIKEFTDDSIGSYTGNYGQYGRGFYFTNDYKYAKSYGDNVLEVYLKIEKPFHWNEYNLGLLNDKYDLPNITKEEYSFKEKELLIIFNKIDKNLVEFYKMYKGTKDDIREKAIDFYLDNIEIDFDDIFDILESIEGIENEPITDYDIEFLESFGISDQEISDSINFIHNMSLDYVTEAGDEWTTEQFTNAIINEGYDGVVYESGFEIVVFNPNQIKSATDNNGNFDPNSNLITEEVENILPEYWYHGTNELFSEFNIDKMGKNYKVSNLGIYFSGDISPPPYIGETAKDYANEAVKRNGGNPYIYKVKINTNNIHLFDSDEYYSSTTALDLNPELFEKYDTVVSYNYDEYKNNPKYANFILSTTDIDNIEIVDIFDLSNNDLISINNNIITESEMEKYDYYTGELNPLVWNGEEKLNEEVSDTLMEIVYDFVTSINNKLTTELEIDDVILTGSLANLNWNKFSDYDLHIVTDLEKLSDEYDINKLAVDELKNNWNKTHDIKINGYDVETYFQDINEPHTASGMYSILNDEWITKPEYDEELDKQVESQENEIVAIFDRYNDQVEKLLDVDIDSLDSEEIEEMQEALDNMNDSFGELRRDEEIGLKSEMGEYSIGNLAFKMLRNAGTIGKLKEVKTTLYDLNYSVDNEILTESVDNKIYSGIEVYDYFIDLGSSTNDHDAIEMNEKQIKNNEYVLKDISIDFIIKNDVNFEDFVENMIDDEDFKNNTSVDSYGLIGDTDYTQDVVIDGYHRLLQSFINGDKSMKMFVPNNTGSRYLK